MRRRAALAVLLLLLFLFSACTVIPSSVSSVLEGLSQKEGSSSLQSAAGSQALSASDASGQNASSGEASQQGASEISSAGQTDESQPEGTSGAGGAQQAGTTPPGDAVQPAQQGGTQPAPTPDPDPEPEPEPDPEPSFSWDEGGNYTGGVSIYKPVASGTKVYKENGAVIDASNSASGYVMIKVTGTSYAKAQVTGPNGGKYNYDINTNGEYEVIPLQMGSGTYNIFVGEKVSGGYAQLVNASISGSNTNYLYPSQYVNYSASSSAIRKAYGLCMNANSDLDKVKSIYNWIIRNISYDYGKAGSVSSGYLPNVDSTYSSRSGICFDYAALMAAMLRSQDVPAKLVIGDATGDYHAWNEVYISGVGWITLGIQSYGGWKRMDSTFGAGGSDMESYIENGSNYTAQRYY